MGNIIEDISQEEHNLINSAQKDYGDYFINCVKLLELMRGVKSLKEESLVFFMFWGQVVSGMQLSISSLIRKHRAQSNMMLRQVLESICFACYGLYETNVNKYGVIEGDCLKPDVLIKREMYEWLDKNYHNYSEFIKKEKGKINELFSHSNIVVTQINMKQNIEDIKTRISFFDNDMKYLIEGELIGRSIMIYTIMKLLINVNKAYPLLNIENNLENDIEAQKNVTDNLIKSLLKNPEIHEIYGQKI